MKKIAVIIIAVVLGFYLHSASAQTAIHNGPCLTFSAGSDNVGIQDDEIGMQNACSYPVAGYACYTTISSTNSCTLAGTLANGLSTGVVSQPVVLDGTAITAFYSYECPLGSNASTTGPEATPTSSAPQCTAVTTSPITAAVLPNAFAAQTNTSATVFASMTLTNGLPGQNCRVAIEPSSNLEFAFQETNPSTNQPEGTKNMPVNIAQGATGTFVLGFEATAPFVQLGYPLIFSCDGIVPLPSITGLSSVDVNFTETATANIVAESATSPSGGVVTVPVGGEGAFAVAADNAGNASASVVVSGDTGDASLPVSIAVCQTNPSTGACNATPAPSVTTSFSEGTTATYSVFVTASGAITLSPATNRIFLRFKLNGVELGATSVAIQN